MCAKKTLHHFAQRLFLFAYSRPSVAHLTVAFPAGLRVMVAISLQRGSLSMSLDISRSSIYSSNSYNSLEQLVPKSQPRRYSTSTTSIRPSPAPAARNINSQSLRVVGPQQKRRMATNGSQAVAIEQKKSYGIGGAGNIRRPSEVIYPQRRNSDGTRRRSSVWSSISASPGTSPEGKRTLFNFFGRKNSVSEDTSGYKEADERRAASNDVDTAGKKMEAE